MSHSPAFKGAFRLRHILETYTFFGTIPFESAFCVTIRWERQVRRHSGTMIKRTKPADSTSCPRVLAHRRESVLPTARYANRGNRRLAHTNRILNQALAKRGRKERVECAVTGFSPPAFLGQVLITIRYAKRGNRRFAVPSFWRTEQDSNLRHQASEACALSS